jgi:tripartite-type tricarboxylate transporter receptor subunit TctC
MKLPRRRFLQLAAGSAVLPAVVNIAAAAQSYPAQPVRVIVGAAPGDSADTVARLMAQSLAERLGQPFVIENRPGAGSNLAAEAAVRAPPDGYTLLLITAANASNASLYRKLSFNLIHDIAPVASILRNHFVMLVNPSFPATTVPEFIAYAKANPGSINMASAGIGTLTHIAGELFKMMAGINMTHVPYRGGTPALADLLGDRVQVLFAVMPEPIEYVRAGKLRALAVTAPSRSKTLPDVPTVGEYVPGYEVSAWEGLGVPRNTPAEIIFTLNSAINAGIADPTMKTRFADLGFTALTGSPGDFGKLIADQTEKWAKVIQAANIKVE